MLSVSSCSIFQREPGYISDYIPRDSDVPGWNRNVTPGTVEGSDAGSYRQDYTGLGISAISWCTYSSFDDRDRTIRIEVIRFNHVIDAFSFFSEIAGFSENGSCPDTEYFNENLSIIRAGEYVIYASTENLHIQNTADLKNFTSISMSYLGDRYSEENLPLLSNVLKRAGASCVLYSRRGISAVAGINRCYYSLINSENRTYFIFLSDRGTNYDAMNLFQKIIAKKYIVLKADNTQSAFIKDETGTYTFISIFDRWIYGCWKVTDINDGKIILQNIRNAVENHSQSDR